MDRWGEALRNADIHVAANQSLNDATDRRARSPDGAGASRLAATRLGHAAERRRGEHARPRMAGTRRGYADELP